MNVLRPVFLFLFLLLALLSFSSQIANAQTTIWSEDFSSYSNGTTTGQGSPSITTWNADGLAGKNNDLGVSVQDGCIEGTRTDGKHGKDTWEISSSDPIDILGYTDVSVSLELTSGGSGLNTNDYISVNYSLDGGSTWTAFPNSSFTGEMGTPTTASVTGLSGSELLLQVVMYNGNNEYYYLDNIVVQGTSGPTLFATPSSLDFGYVVNGSFGEMSFDISGVNLDGSEVTVAGQGQFEVSTTSRVGFSNSVTINYSGSTLSATTVYVRFIPDADDAYYSETITVSDNGSASSIDVAVSGNTEPDDYCSAASTSPTQYESITNVSFAGIDNTSDVAKTVGYIDYTSIVTSGEINAGETYSISVTEEFLDQIAGGYCKVYIDYNQDGSFDETTELVFGDSYYGNQTMTGSVIIPDDVAGGETKMRIILEGEADETGALTCENFTWGEVEDYTLNVTPMCNADIPVLTASENPVCAGEDVTISISGTLYYAEEWIVYSGSCDGTPVDSTSLSTIDISGLISTTTYYIRGETGCVQPGDCGSIELTVEDFPVAGTASGEQNICGSETPSEITLTGYSGTIQWQDSISGGSWSNISGASSATLTSVQIGTINQTTYFRAVLTNGNCSPAYSNEVTVTVNENPTITFNSSTAELCFGETTSALYYSATSGNPGTYTIDFDATAIGEGFIDVPSTNFPANSIEITVPATASNGTYNATLKVENTTTGCSSEDIDITIIINPLPATGIIETD